MVLIFEWNPRKHRVNIGKHGIGFSEAASVFGDPLARLSPDEDHSEDEARGIIIGHSKKSRLLFVSFMNEVSGEFASLALAVLREENS